MHPLPPLVMWYKHWFQFSIRHYHGLNTVSHWVKLKAERNMLDTNKVCFAIIVTYCMRLLI